MALNKSRYYLLDQDNSALDLSAEKTPAGDYVVTVSVDNKQQAQVTLKEFDTAVQIPEPSPLPRAYVAARLALKRVGTAAAIAFVGNLLIRNDANGEITAGMSITGVIAVID